MKNGNWDFLSIQREWERTSVYESWQQVFFFERSGVCLESQESGEVWIIFQSETWNSRVCTHMTTKRELEFSSFDRNRFRRRLNVSRSAHVGNVLHLVLRIKSFKWNHSYSDDQLLRIGIQKPDQVKHYSLSRDWGGKIKWRPTFEVSLLCKIEIKFPRRILCSSIRAMCMRDND